jgi:hypothetical protein
VDPCFVKTPIDGDPVRGKAEMKLGVLRSLSPGGEQCRLA